MPGKQKDPVSVINLSPEEAELVKIASLDTDGAVLVTITASGLYGIWNKHTEAWLENQTGIFCHENPAVLRAYCKNAGTPAWQVVQISSTGDPIGVN